MNKLTKQQQAFVDAYLCDPELNGAECVRKAGYKTKYPDKIAYQLLENPRVKAAIDVARVERAKRVNVDADWVMQRWINIVEADPNEIIHFRRVCCRYCFGRDHAYQWADRAEYEAAIAHAKASAKKGKPPVIPSDSGGYGFDPTIRPHPKCPNCHGEGYGQLHASDTRDLSPRAKALYAGAKATAAGLEIKLHDQEKALENIARHLGMFQDNVNLKLDPGDLTPEQAETIIQGFLAGGGLDDSS